MWKYLGAVLSVAPVIHGYSVFVAASRLRSPCCMGAGPQKDLVLNKKDLTLSKKDLIFQRPQLPQVLRGQRCLKCWYQCLPSLFWHTRSPCSALLSSPHDHLQPHSLLLPAAAPKCLRVNGSSSILWAWALSFTAHIRVPQKTPKPAKHL